MLFDLSGLTREELVTVQASISNELDFDRVAEALIIQHPRIYFQESQRRTTGRGKDGFRPVDNLNTRWFRGKGKRQTHWQRKTWSECPPREPHFL